METASDVLRELRPVTFQYRAEVNGAGDSQQYGLLAEEVAEIAPELVIYDAAGQPYSVRYHLLAPMLLNEMQKQQRVIEELKEVNTSLVERVARLEQGEQPVADVRNSP